MVPNNCCTFGSKVTEEIHLRVSFLNEVNQYEVLLRPTEDDSLFVADETAYFRSSPNRNKPYSEGLAPRLRRARSRNQ